MSDASRRIGGCAAASILGLHCGEEVCRSNQLLVGYYVRSRPRVRIALVVIFFGRGAAR